jgi:hypothetical protein
MLYLVFVFLHPCVKRQHFNLWVGLKLKHLELRRSFLPAGDDDRLREEEITD